eukprot:2801981-Pyramimonas_sp.AAC.1
MDRLRQFEKTIQADRASGARRAVVGQTSTAATTGSTAAPTINLDEVSAEKVGEHRAAARVLEGSQGAPDGEIDKAEIGPD